MSKLPVTLMGISSGLLKAPERVPFGSLQVDPERFQVRNPKACSAVDGYLLEQASQTLTKTLLDAVEGGDELDPLVVWKSPDGALWVIDGHHRYEALAEAGTTPGAKVWVQRFTGTSAGEARHFALDVNRRDHLDLHEKERFENCWRFILTGEAVGRVRERAKRYRIGKSTVSRMDAKAPAVLEQLRALATTEGVNFDEAFIRSHAPTWKGMDDTSRATEGDPDALEAQAIERMVKSLTLRYAKEAKAYPDRALKALEMFYTGTTGRHVYFKEEVLDSADQEF